MEIGISMVNVIRELMFEVNDDDAEQLKTDLESAFEAKTSMLWVSDRDGRNVGLAVDRLAYIEFGAPGDRRIAFATD